MRFLCLQIYPLPCIHYLLSRSAGPQMIPPQTYDYAALNAIALDPVQLVENNGSGGSSNTVEL